MNLLAASVQLLSFTVSDAMVLVTMMVEVVDPTPYRCRVFG